ncbi:MAG: hypothetical protein N2109_08215 [Fimbriimonadales bacterium]|nr:hypothetical protein [Fimbriimonadales bacterium]
MKRRSPPYALISLLVVGLCVILGFGLMQLRANMPPPEQTPQEQPEAVGEEREAPSKEELAAQIQSKAGAADQVQVPPKGVPPGALPPGAGGSTIFLVKPRMEKPKVDESSTASQWYTDVSRKPDQK